MFWVIILFILVGLQPSPACPDGYFMESYPGGDAVKCVPLEHIRGDEVKA